MRQNAMIGFGALVSIVLACSGEGGGPLEPSPAGATSTAASGSGGAAASATAQQSSSMSSGSASAGGAGGQGGGCMAGGPANCPTQGCACVAKGLVPLTDLGSGQYQGEPGGLYGNGSNTRPGPHDAAGLALAKSIEPRDMQGKPSANGKYVFLSIGLSNTTQEFSAFIPKANAAAGKDSHLVIVDGAQGARPASSWAQPNHEVWTVVQQRLANAGVSSAQVGAVWIKLANPAPMGKFPTYAKTLQGDLLNVVHNLRDKFPNLKVGYMSSRIYGGYATTPLNPEPYAYESGFSVKWLIGDQIAGKAELNYDPSKGTVVAPWLAWGPYIWADGANPRCDGLTFSCQDFASNDGTHPSNSGQSKVADMLLAFLQSDTTAREWFLASP
jgi:hypothetical protein